MQQFFYNTSAGYGQTPCPQPFEYPHAGFFNSDVDLGHCFEIGFLQLSCVSYHRYFNPMPR